MTRRYGRAPRGQRLAAAVPHGHHEPRPVAGNASQSERNDTCILGRMTPSTVRAALVGVAHCGQFARNLLDRTTTLTLASVLLLILPLFGRAARSEEHTSELQSLRHLV